MKLIQLIEQYKVAKQVIFTHHLQDNCVMIKQLNSEVRTMLWIGGTAEMRINRYNEIVNNGFKGLDQVQFHLKNFQPDHNWSYDLSEQFLLEAYKTLTANGIDMEVFPFHFNDRSIQQLLELGISWYATDEPAKFINSVKHALK